MGLLDKFKKEQIAEQEPEVILESNSPICDIQAFVEKSATCYYFYLWVHPLSQNPQMKACWICNRGKAAKKLDVDAMGKGQAPAMPAEYVAHPSGGMELDSDKLSIVWFEEGDAAALLSEGELICVIPGWSGYNGFPGYSRYAKGTGPYAWEMTQALQGLSTRVNKCARFWDYFETEFWGDVQKMHMDVLEQFFGKHEKYFAIDGEKFPPKALLTGNTAKASYAISAGVSLMPMPKAEQYFGEESGNNRRIELGFSAVPEHKSLCEFMGSTISAIATMPWREITFLAHGHTVPFPNIKGFAAILFVNPKLIPDMEKPEYKPFMDNEINLLWMVPIVQEEYDYVVHNGMEALMQKAVNKEKLHVFDGRRKFDFADK